MSQDNLPVENPFLRSVYDYEPPTPAEYAAMQPEKVLRTIRVIAGALVAGVVLFAVVACVIVFRPAPVAPPVKAEHAAGQTLLVSLSALFACGAVVLSFVIPNTFAKVTMQMVSKMTQEGTASGPKELFGRLLSAARMRMIVAMALVEGAAFFGLIAFIVTKSVVPLAIVGGLLFVLTIHFPTKFKLARWLEGQQRALS